MQTFIDTETEEVYEFEDDIHYEEGVLYRGDIDGPVVGSAPVTLVPHVIPEQEPIPLTEGDFTRGVQEHLDVTAQTRNYDSMNSLVSYVGDNDPIFSSEGTAGKIWRSNVWRYSADQLTLIRDASRPAPETVGEFIAELPEMAW